jgi:hypothetical protein
MDPQIGTLLLLHSWAMSQACTFTHSTVLPSCSLNLRDTVSPQNVVTRVSLLEVDQTPLLPPEAGLNLNQDSYQSDEWGSQVGSQAFPGSFCDQNSPPLFTRREVPFPWINRSSGAWQWQPSWQAGDSEPVTGR